MAIVGVAGILSTLALIPALAPESHQPRAALTHFLALAVLVVSLTAWLIPLHLAAWVQGMYELDAMEPEVEKMRMAAPKPMRMRTPGRTDARAQSYYLIAGRGLQRGLPVRITANPFVLGSQLTCHFVDARFNPTHCAFVLRARQFVVRDLRGDLPIAVNGTTVPTGSEWPLLPGDRVDLNGVEFFIQTSETPMSQRELEEWAAHILTGDAERWFNEDDDVYKAQKTMASAAAQDMLDRLKPRRRSAQGRVKIELEGDLAQVRFNDRDIVDERDIGLLRKELIERLERSPPRILLDFKNVRRLSADAILMLIDLCRHFHHEGSQVAMCRVNPEVGHLIPELQAVDAPYFHDKGSAIAAEKW